MLGIVGRHEFVARIGVGHIIAGRDDVLAVGAQHLQDVLLHAGLDGGCERGGGFVRIGEGLLRFRRRRHQAQARDCNEACEEANMSYRMKNGHGHILDRVGICAPPATQSW